MNVVQGAERTRLVLNLRRPVPHEASVDGRTLVISLAGAPVAQAGTNGRVAHFAEGRGDVEAPDPGRRLPPRHRRRGPGGGGPFRHHDRHRHPYAGPEHRRRLPEDHPARGAAPAARRGGLRHAGEHRKHLPAGRERAHGDRASRPVGAQRLPVGHAVRGRGEARPGRPLAGVAARPLHRREAVAQLPERRSARGAERDRRLHRSQRHHQRHGERQHHPAAEGRALGSGARDHPADARPRQPPRRQRDLDCAARRARDAREARARGGEPDPGPRADAHRVVPDELPEGGGRAEALVRPGAAHPFQARQRRRRRAHQHAVRAGRAEPSRRSTAPHRQDRRRGAPGDDRGAHRGGERRVLEEPRGALRLQRRVTNRGPPRARARQPALPR